MRRYREYRDAKEKAYDDAPLPDAYPDSVDEHSQDPLFARDTLTKFVGVTGK